MESVGYSMDDVTKGGHLLHPTIEMVTPREEKSDFFEIEEEFWEENLKFFIRNSENIINLDFKYLFFVTLAKFSCSKSFKKAVSIAIKYEKPVFNKTRIRHSIKFFMFGRGRH